MTEHSYTQICKPAFSLKINKILDESAGSSRFLRKPIFRLVKIDMKFPFTCCDIYFPSTANNPMDDFIPLTINIVDDIC